MQHFLRLLLVLFSTILSSQNPSIKSVPSWVIEVSYQESIKNEEAESGYYYLLYDKQINTQQKSRYSNSVVKIINGEGIGEMSNLTFEFDPSYEKLIFHKIDLIRDGERISKLNLRDIETIQRESNLEKNLYDGRLTSLINLTDVRKGDIIDYAYTIVGANPVYDGGYSNNFYFQYAVPVGKLHYIVNVPNDNSFEFKYFNDAPEATINIVEKTKAYEWSLENVTPKFYDPNTPVWYDDYGFVQFGNYPSWEAVVNQYKELYTLSTPDKKKLKQLSDQHIKSKTKDIVLSKEDIAKSLIDFVQDEVRYFGFEDGMNSHRPESPLKVLDQRYGDCKGKSFLLSELLQANGIEAYPMLVHSSNGKGLDDKLPTPNLFNHCVVTYELDGKQLYIDPTISNQGSGINGKYFPNYEKGLVLKSGEQKLTTIEFVGESAISISEFYDVKAINGGGELSVVTTYKGSQADRVRADFEQRSNASIQKDYLRFYSALYPNIRKGDDIETEDLRETRNEFIVRESYDIDSIWATSSENESLIYIETYPLLLESYVNPTTSPERAAPYAINYPLDIDFDITVNLPEEWEFEDYKNTIESSYFTYEQEASNFGTKLLVSHKYSRKKDFVDAVDVRKYIADHDEVQDDLSYFITYDFEEASAIENSGLSWISIFLVLLTIIFASYGAYRLYYEYDIPAKGNYKEGKSIGGWLILLAIGLVFTPIGIIVQILSEEGYYDAYTWSALWNTEGLSGKPMVLVIALEMIINVALVIYSIVLIILFFKKRTVVPKLMIILYASMLILLILDTVAANLLAPDLYSAEENQEFLKDIMKALFRCTIWIPYFVISKRVKETFVNRGPNYVEPEEINNDILGQEKVYLSENDKPYNSLESRFGKDA
ncbi:DUF3857 domain-containing protein [uncultured Dokdonia sp.]|uniref:DUF3857 domain-containing protein n=1 Tax=unclassified Dokdonia TaxID=2615033 RepID=UPI0026264BBF|nr:DUF3857 domain-containing protein [uncultured Dokdonia sp.]